MDAAIQSALGDAQSIAQRPPRAAPVIRSYAEELPFPDDSFDAAMAIFSDHHRSDRQRGLAELRRVARRRWCYYVVVAEITSASPPGEAR